MSRAESLAERALKAANGDPIVALNAAVTVAAIQKPELVEQMRAAHRAKQRKQRTG